MSIPHLHKYNLFQDFIRDKETELKVCVHFSNGERYNSSIIADELAIFIDTVIEKGLSIRKKSKTWVFFPPHAIDKITYTHN